MAFRGPDSSDFENITALNRAWLELVARDAGLASGLDGLATDLKDRLVHLTGAQIARLARTPFLLFSFRENDERFWSRVFSVKPDGDLFAVNPSEEADTLISAGLGFAWQLAHRNGYALRLLYCASTHWGERIAEQTFLGLLGAFRANGEPPAMRFAQNNDLWRKLLGGGVSRQNLASSAAQITALQSVLTQTHPARQSNWQVAARSMEAPRHRVAEPKETTQE